MDTNDFEWTRPQLGRNDVDSCSGHYGLLAGTVSSANTGRQIPPAPAWLCTRTYSTFSAPGLSCPAGTSTMKGASSGLENGSWFRFNLESLKKLGERLRFFALRRIKVAIGSQKSDAPGARNLAEIAVGLQHFVSGIEL